MFEDNVVVPLDPTHTHRGITGSILRMKDDSLLFIHAKELEPTSGWLESRRSTDNGKTWDEPFWPFPVEEKLDTIAPTLMRLPSGEILLFYIFETLPARTPGWGDYTMTCDRHMYLRRSNDEGQTWSHPICAAHYPSICQAQPDEVVRLSSGRILIPVECPWPTSCERYVSFCFFSDDEGYSWWPSKNVVDTKNQTEEPSVVEMDDGRLVMVCRTRLGYLARAYSEDSALTWSEPEMVKDLNEPCAGFHTVRIPTTGDLLTIFCNNPLAPAHYGGEEQPEVQVGELKIHLGAVRAPLATAISQDEGKTWGHFRNITSDPEGAPGDYGYPGLTWIDGDSVALINYHALDGIHLARIGVDWFYGK